MKTLASPLILFLGVMLPSRLSTVISFSPTATRAQVTETINSLSTITLKSMALRGQANGEDNSNGRKSSVAIIGGGIAGLSCARHLQHRFDVTVYDTGRLRPGGRASSRQPNDLPKDDGENCSEYPLLSQFRFDHAAQFITSTTSTTSKWRTNFDQQIQEWIDQDILRESPPNSIYVFEKKATDTKSNQVGTNSWTEKCINPSSSAVSDHEQQRFYYPTRGMSSLVDSLVAGSTFELRQDVWVSPSSGIRFIGKKGSGRDNWSVRAQGRTLGEYDNLIIAHNGKCADRLMSKTPAKDVHRLLRTNFNDRVPANGGQKMTLNSIYSLTFCVKGPSLLSTKLPKAFVGGFIQNHPRLGLVTCQTNKYPRGTYSEKTSKSVEDDDDRTEVWTILSTASFAKKNKAPQEFLPEDVIQNVTRLLIDSVEKDLLGNLEGSDADPRKVVALRDEILESRLQLWGAAVPLNVWRGDIDNVQSSSKSPGFIHDPKYHVGVCGDWLLEASIAGAWSSGRRMAQHMTNISQGSNSKLVGVKGHFEASQSVRQLGLASLDGPMNDDAKIQPTESSSQNNTRRNGSRNSNKKRHHRNQSRSRKQT